MTDDDTSPYLLTETLQQSVKGQAACLVDQDDPRERAAEAEPDPVEDENEDDELFQFEAVIDASIRPAQTDAIAQHHGLTRAAYISEIKAMYYPGTRASLLNYPQHHGDWVASWLPPEGTVCWQAALLSAAHSAAYGQWTTVKFC